MEIKENATVKTAAKDESIDNSPGIEGLAVIHHHPNAIARLINGIQDFKPTEILNQADCDVNRQGRNGASHPPSC